MATRTIGGPDALSVQRLLQVLTVLLVVVGVGLIFVGDPLLATVGIVLFILSVVAFLGVVKYTFEGHPDW